MINARTSIPRLGWPVVRSNYKLPSRITRRLLCLGLLGSLHMFSHPPLEVQSVRDSRVLVAWGEAGISTVDAFLLRHPEYSPGRTLGFTLTNVGNSPIIALTVRWKWTDVEGRTQIHDVRTDSLFFVRLPVISPRQTLIVFPGMFVAQHGHSYGLSGIRSLDHTLRQFDGAANLSASVDCVVFEDGLLLGPDESGTVDSLRVRKKVAEEVAAVVLNSIQSSRDIAAALDDYSRAWRGVGSRAEQGWRQRLTRLAQPPRHGASEYPPERQPHATASRLLKLPELPVLRRP